jgi:hypothetical protein
MSMFPLAVGGAWMLAGVVVAAIHRARDIKPSSVEIG